MISPQGKRLWLAAAFSLLACNTSMANIMTVTWSDVHNDQGAVGDVIGASLTFDDTGAWTAHWWADPSHPFTGNARFNLNLFDTALGNLATAFAPQVSLDGFINFGASTATDFSYSGLTPYLHNWKIGDIISTGNVTNFESGAVSLNSPFSRDKLLTSAPVMGVVPEPKTLLILVTGLGLMGLLARRRKKYLDLVHSSR